MIRHGTLRAHRVKWLLGGRLEPTFENAVAVSRQHICHPAQVGAMGELLDSALDVWRSIHSTAVAPSHRTRSDRTRATVDRQEEASLRADATDAKSVAWRTRDGSARDESPTQKMPGRLVSSSNGVCSTLSSRATGISPPVSTKPCSSRASCPSSHSVLGAAPMKTNSPPTDSIEVVLWP